MGPMSRPRIVCQLQTRPTWCRASDNACQVADDACAAGNHTVIGLYDLPMLVYELYVRGYKVRGLAHPGHWKTPLGPIFESLGAVQASPMAAYRLLRNSEAVLLFPGGSREVILIISNKTHASQG